MLFEIFIRVILAVCLEICHWVPNVKTLIYMLNKFGSKMNNLLDTCCNPDSFLAQFIWFLMQDHGQTMKINPRISILHFLVQFM